MSSQMLVIQAEQARHVACRRHASTRRSLCARITLHGHVITPSMQRVFDVVNRKASFSHPMPNNPILGELAGGHGRSTVLRALNRLSKAGIIKIERRERRRRVVIIATGQSTDWGEARLGHSPHIHRHLGEPLRAVRTARARAPSSRALKAQFTPIPEPSMPEGAQFPQLWLEIAALPSCQFPEWRDGERPGKSPLFCNKSRSRTASYCLDHLGLCNRFSPERRR